MVFLSALSAIGLKIGSLIYILPMEVKNNICKVLYWYIINI
jgi:hypothetical protein